MVVEVPGCQGRGMQACLLSGIGAFRRHPMINTEGQLVARGHSWDRLLGEI